MWVLDQEDDAAVWVLDQEDDAAVWVLDQEDERMQQCGCLTKKTAECVGVIQRNTQKSKHYCSFENRSSGRTFPNATVRSRTDVSSRTLVNVVELESCIRFRAFRNATEHPRTGVLYRDPLYVLKQMFGMDVPERDRT